VSLVILISLLCPLSSEYPHSVPCYPQNITAVSLVILIISLLCPFLSSEYPHSVPCYPRNIAIVSLVISEYHCCVPCYPHNTIALSLVIGISPFCPLLSSEYPRSVPCYPRNILLRPPARAACTCHHIALQFPGEQCSGTFRVDELIGTLRCTLHQGQGTKLGRSSRISLLRQKKEKQKPPRFLFLSGIKRSLPLVFLFYHKTYFCTFFVKSRLLVIPDRAEFGSFRRHCVCCLACRV
jgi:hypothetical protein